MSTSLALDTLGAQIAVELTSHSQTIDARAHEMATSSESEVGSAVDALSGTVTEATAYVREVESLLGDLTSSEGSDLEDALVSQRAMLGELGRLLNQHHSEQEERVKDALDRCSDILHAADRITQVSSASDTLALYARVETSVLGDDSGELILVADELQKLNGTVNSANVLVRRLVSGLRTALPSLIEDSTDLHAQVLRFNQEAEADMEAIAQGTQAMGCAVQDVCSRGTERSQEVVVHTQAALSHLAVQDPMAQKLRRLSSQVDSLKERMAAIFVGDLESPEEEAAQEEDLDMGDMLLF